MTLPTNRTTASTPAQHVADHNTAHGLLNDLSGTYAAWVTGLTAGGVVDNTAVLQAAVDAAPAGTTLRLPAGEFKFSSLAITKSLTIIGEGWQNFNQAAFGDASWGTSSNYNGTVLISTATTGAAFSCTGASIQFNPQHFMLIGPGSGTSSGVGYGASGGASSESRPTNVMVANFALGWSLVWIEDSTFLDCRARGCKTGFNLDAATNQNVFINIEIQHSDTDAIVLHDSDANRFFGGLIQNTAGTSGVRIITGQNNLFDGFYVEHSAFGTPTNAISVLAGSNNAFVGWYLSDANNVSVTGGSSTRLEDIRNSSGGTLTIGTGATYTAVINCAGFTTFSNTGAYTFTTRGVNAIPVGTYTGSSLVVEADGGGLGSALEFKADSVPVTGDHAVFDNAGRTWHYTGGGGNLKIDTGTGGSYLDLRGYGVQFHDHTGALKVTAMAGKEGFALGSSGDTNVYRVATDLLGTDDDFSCETIGKGVLLKSPNAHHWRLAVSDAGVISATDIGL